MEKYNILLTLIICGCLTACQWNLEEIDLANAQATCLQNCVNGTCNSNNICECQADWEGVNCDEATENPTININFCDTVNCNNGTCNEALNKCDCEDGWMGEDCSTEIGNEAVTFEKTISIENWNLEGLQIHQTTDNHYLVVAKKVNALTNLVQIYVAKLNLTGYEIWNFSREILFGWDIGLTEINNEYHIGTADHYLKFDSEGNLLFFKILETHAIVSIKRSNQNEILLIGETGTNVAMPNSKIWLAKLNNNGEINFEKTYGGSKDDIGIDGIVLDDGFLITGISYSNDFDIPTNYGLSDVFLIKTDLAGNLLWSKNYGGSSTDSPYSLERTNDNGCILVCSSSSKDFDISNENSLRTWVFRVDKAGDMVWQKKYGDYTSDNLVSIQSGNQNNFLLAGTDANRNNGNWEYYYWLIKIDSFGNIIWKKTYGTTGSEQLSDMQVTSDGGFIMVGTKDDKDIYIVKTDANGEI